MVRTIIGFFLTLCCATSTRAQWVKLPEPSHQSSMQVFSVSDSVIVAEIPMKLLSCSTDEGSTWTAFPGLPHQEGVAPTGFGSVGNIYITEYQNYLLYLPDSSGYYRSTDRGATWRKFDVAPSDLDLNVLLSFGNRFFAGSSNQGMYVSDDRGVTWVHYQDSVHDAGLRRSSLYCLDTNGGVLFAGGSAGVFRSLDTGRSWERFADGIQSDAAWAMKSLGSIQFVSVYDSNLFSHLYRRMTGSKLWAPLLHSDSLSFDPVSSIAVHDSTIVWGDPLGKISYSSDAGTTWISLPGISAVSGPQTPYYLQADATYLFAGIDGLWRRRLNDVSSVPTDRSMSRDFSNAYPNPAFARARISFILQRADRVTIAVVDALGRRVFTSVQSFATGAVSTELSLARLPAGMYPCELSGTYFSSRTKLLHVQ